jgi:hypothetical protein
MLSRGSSSLCETDLDQLDPKVVSLRRDREDKEVLVRTEIRRVHMRIIPAAAACMPEACRFPRINPPPPPAAGFLFQF